MRVLVIGGTGPTGPQLVNALLARGNEVIILHGGFHEVQFDQEIEHIHTDPHFAETLMPALEGRTFDLVVATYGRIKVIAEVLRGKTGRLVTVSGAGLYAAPTDQRWGPLGRPVMVREDSPLRDTEGPNDKLFHKIYLTERTVMAMHEAGEFSATILRYPIIYGPNAPASVDWCIVRRILDKRRCFILGDGGLQVSRRGFSVNVAHCLQLIVDQPQVSSGQIYHVADDDQYTLRQRAELIARALGHQWEYVNLPHSLACCVSPLWKESEHLAFDTTKIRGELGYRDLVPAGEAVMQSAVWLAEHGPKRAAEMEKQLGDPFAYEAEDAVVQLSASQGLVAAAAVQFPEIGGGHMYRHPRKPGEAWSPQVEKGPSE